MKYMVNLGTNALYIYIYIYIYIYRERERDRSRTILCTDAFGKLVIN